jgi:putative serine/threonine protein kinase
MHQEAEKLKAANSVGVGPKFLGVSRDFLMMRFTEGNLLPAWLEMSKGKKQVKRVLRSALEQCWRLDCIGLDHGELSHAPKHVMITSNGKPVVLDFETSSFNRRPSNVTSICQFFFISGAVADGIARRLDVVNKETLVEALKRYKGKRTRRNFEELLKVCRL